MTSDRKKDHIALAFESQTGPEYLDRRFYYEPMLSGHPDLDKPMPVDFLGKQLSYPVWISSMTGGTREAKNINRNLARMCGEFGFGMGLGSCRIILDDDTYLEDFKVRKYIGRDLPLYANLGIAQVEELIGDKQLFRIEQLIDKLDADGLIVHVNPLQEWLQPEGDRFTTPPIETIGELLDKLTIPLIVKEVGQGMGPASLHALLKMPVEAIEFAANGGTNFSKLELLRSDERHREVFGQIARIGHTAHEMVAFVNRIVANYPEDIRCRQVIISGGVKNYMDGYYLVNKLNLRAVYGQASGFLKHARDDYETLRQHAASQIEGLKLAGAFLRIQ